MLLTAYLIGTNAYALMWIIILQPAALNELQQGFVILQPIIVKHTFDSGVIVQGLLSQL
jgi:hypothetical protein